MPSSAMLMRPGDECELQEKRGSQILPATKLERNEDHPVGVVQMKHMPMVTEVGQVGIMFENTPNKKGF